MSHRRVLVVGTTSDYIDLIDRRFPGRAIFLTDTKQRQSALEPAPEAPFELLVDLSQSDIVLQLLSDHLDKWNIELSGIACYDCESLDLAARIAEIYYLPFVSRQAVHMSRNKYLSKVTWQQAGVNCPQVGLGRTLQDARTFHESVSGPIVIKPLTGSGSELVFLCHDLKESFHAVRQLKGKLAQHPDERMYSTAVSDDHENAREFFVMEEYIGGSEYSADFIVDNGELQIIRLAEKIPERKLTTGTTLAYIIPGSYPGDLAALRDTLLKAASSLGIERSICMVDFIVRDNFPYLLELTPRPGGDCLPFLIRQSSGLDMLGLELDVAEQDKVRVPEPHWHPLVGLRLFARRSGTVTGIDIEELRQDARVIELYLKRRPGHRVVLPPNDYDSRLIGHVIFRPKSRELVEEECVQLAGRMKLRMETSIWTIPMPL
jgi:biotin carboxylase